MIEHDETKSIETHFHHKPLQLFKPELTFIALYLICVYTKHIADWGRRKETRKNRWLTEENKTKYKESKG